MQDTAKEKIGSTLVYIGEVGVPLGMGMVLGYWISDRGVPWLPGMLSGLSAYALVCIALMVAGHGLRGKAFEETPVGSRLRKRMLLFLALTVLAGVGRLIVWQSEAVGEAPSLEEIAAEAGRYQDLDRELENLIAGWRIQRRWHLSRMGHLVGIKKLC
jgi:hypothetical protein